MTAKELKLIIEEGEGYRIEFKESLNNIDKEFVAFANASGGRLFLGISDDKIVRGVNADNTLKSQVQDVANNCDPRIPVQLEVFRNTLIVHVREGADKPYRCSSGFYLRVGPNSQKMNRDEIVAFIKAEGKVRFDELVCAKFNFKKHFDTTKLRKLLELAGITTSLDTRTMLENLGAAERREGRVVVNNTGALFLSKNLDDIYKHTVVTCVLYKGTEKVDILDRKDFNEDLLSSIDQAMIFLKRHLPLRYEITGAPRRTEVLEIPEQALREAVINAVTHRDYFEHGANVMVEIFDDRVEISNPGGLVKGLTPENFGKKSILRNPTIASLLHRIDYIEKMGTGISRMRKALREAKLPVPNFEFDSFFTVTLKRPVKKAFVPARVGDAVNEAINEAVREGVLEGVDEGIRDTVRDTIDDTVGDTVDDTVRGRLIIRVLYLLQREAVSLSEMRSLFKLSVPTVKRDIAVLRKAGLIILHGTTRKGKYVLTAKGRRLFTRKARSR